MHCVLHCWNITLMPVVQVLQELEKHFKSACQNPSSLYPGAAPLLSAAQPAPCMTTAAAARPQLQPTSAASGQLAPFGTNTSKLCRSGTSASLPLPKKIAKKRSRAESSNASLEAAINSLRSDTTPSPSTTLSDSQILPPGPFPSSGLTANMPLTAFSSSAAVRLVLLAGATGSQGIPGTGPALGNPATSVGPAGPAAASSGAGAAGPSSGAALELSLLLTTLQSLAQLPGEQGQPINLIASSSQVAEAQLRDWLRQLQQHAANAPGEVVSMPCMLCYLIYCPSLPCFVMSFFSLFMLCTALLSNNSFSLYSVVVWLNPEAVLTD